MSADNYLSIRKEEDGKFRIYMESASDEEAPRFEGGCWGQADDMEKAVSEAQRICGETTVEYGYKFYGVEANDEETKKKQTHIRNPKQNGSNLFDCKPQVGKCPIDCNQCFYNREGAFYIDIDKPHMPTIEEVGDGIMRVNCGHDSNIEREKVIAETAVYPRRFFNTSITCFDFPAPVVFTANANEEDRASLISPPDNLMFIRLRVSSTNLQHVAAAVSYYHKFAVPVVLTFMAYYDKKPEHEENYEWKKRHINSYWCPTTEFMAETLRAMKIDGGRQVVLCGNLDSYKCKDCRNCETYYWQTIKHMREVKL